MRRLLVLVTTMGVFLITSCNVHKVSVEAFHPDKCEFLNAEGDGSITVRAYGQGRNRGDAFEQARKNAVREVLLNGIDVPGNVVMSRPLLLGANNEERYASFLNEFFKDGGDYMRFVSRIDRRLGSNVKSWSGAQMKMSLTVRVYRSELEQYLRYNNIIAQKSYSAPENYRYDIEYCRTAGDGIVQLKVWSYAKRSEEALSQCRRNAVHGVIFRGYTGDTSAVQYPIVTDPTVETTWADYFDAFFSDNGPYLRSVISANDGAAEVQKVGNEYKVGVVVTVNKAMLRKHLEDSDITCGLSSYY